MLAEVLTNRVRPTNFSSIPRTLNSKILMQKKHLNTNKAPYVLSVSLAVTLFSYLFVFRSRLGFEKKRDVSESYSEYLVTCQAAIRSGP